ncbi:hypothetical protein QC823_15040 [Halomonas vilamensis]|uniref:Uncharacterized protein n=1 Tax=Vreelandella vilamensis TaxID=531309 RepID=A0ABU1H7L4_9GAMM|nr:hypothetical protein [Halomonas vilamensis]MDR5900285.1 hypothetical protein [Halomonas vilamensis]
MTQDIQNPAQGFISPVSTEHEKSTEDKIAIVCYALMMTGPLLWFTPLIAVVIAYVQQGDAPTFTRTHYRNIISTFWVSVLFFMIAIIAYLGFVVLMISGSGFGATLLVSLASLAFTIWIYVRLVKGLLYLIKGKAWI